MLVFNLINLIIKLISNLTKGHQVNKKQYQSGSGHLVIIFILVIALLGAVGYVFYDRFVDKKGDNSDNTTTVTTTSTVPSEVALTEIIADNTGGSNLAIKYPSTWALSDYYADNTGVNGTHKKITSPDNKVVVKFSYNLSSQMGGVCYADDNNSDNKVITLAYLDTADIANYQAARFVAYIDNNTKTGAYTYEASAQINKEPYNLRFVGDTTESCSSFQYASKLIVDIPDSELDEIVSVVIELKNINEDSSFDDIKAEMATDNFQIAKRIVQSLYVKE